MYLNDFFTCIYILQDFFHAQILHGDLTANLKKYLPYTGTLLWF